MNQESRKTGRGTRTSFFSCLPAFLIISSSSAFLQLPFQMILPETLLRQTRLRFPRLEATEVEISPIEKGGSDRKFYRIQFSPGQSIILVKYTREQAENERYVAIAEFLAAHGCAHPEDLFSRSGGRSHLDRRSRRTRPLELSQRELGGAAPPLRIGA